jgi:hypothetical protein
MKYTLLYLYAVAGMLALTACSKDDDDVTVVPEAPQTATVAEDYGSRVSWRARATTPEELRKVEDAISAIRGAGYTYRDNDHYCIGTDMEVFNMRRLRDMEEKYHTTYLVDDYMPVTEQKFFYSESINALKDSLSIDVGIGFSAGVFSMDLEVGFNKSSFQTTKNYYTLMRMKQSYFSRDINYLNLREQVTEAITNSPIATTYPSVDADSIAKVVPFFREAYAPGFSEVMQKFIRNIHAAPSAFAASGLCREFIEEVGSGFVTRSVLGCSLDYYNTTRMDSVSDKLDVKVALEMSVQIKFITISAGLSVEYKNEAERCSRNSESHTTARGGNVSLVTAFTTGQQATLDPETLNKWQKTVTPQDAALIDIRLVPIYEVIYDAKTRTVLKNYMEKSLRNYEEE